jgi:hypothetical protein
MCVVRVDCSGCVLNECLLWARCVCVRTCLFLRVECAGCVLDVCINQFNRAHFHTLIPALGLQSLLRRVGSLGQRVDELLGYVVETIAT